MGFTSPLHSGSSTSLWLPQQPISRLHYKRSFISRLHYRWTFILRFKQCTWKSQFWASRAFLAISLNPTSGNEWKARNERSLKLYKSTWHRQNSCFMHFDKMLKRILNSDEARLTCHLVWRESPLTAFAESSRRACEFVPADPDDVAIVLSHGRCLCSKQHLCGTTGEITIQRVSKWTSLCLFRTMSLLVT